MIIEFQIKSNPFLVALRNQLKRTLVCAHDPMPLAAPGCDDPVLLDRIKYSDDTQLIRVGGRQIQIKQPVELFFTTLADLEAHGAASTPPCWKPTIILIFNLSLTLNGAVPSLCLTFSKVQADGQLSAGWLPLFTQILSNMVPEQCNPLNLEPILRMLNQTPQVVRAELSGDQALNRLAVRLDLAPASSSQESWDQFLSGLIGPNPNGSDWTLFIDKQTLEQSTQNRFSLSLQEPIDADKFSLESGPGAVYFMDGPRVFVSFTGEVIDACVCLWGEIDLNVDINAWMTISVPEADVIQLDLSLNWSLNTFESICCAFTAGIFWGFIGTNLLQEGKINWGEFLGGFAGGFTLPTVFTAMLAGSHGIVGDHIKAPNKDWIPVGDENKKFRLMIDAALGNPGLGLMTLSSLTGLPEGIVLGGSLGSLAEVADFALVASIDNFGWGWKDACADLPILKVKGGVTISNANEVGHPPSIQICDSNIVLGSDPLNQFGPYLFPDAVSVRVEIPLDKLLPEYKSNPYPCKFQISSNAGKRVITIPPVPIPTNREIHAHQQHLEFTLKLLCQERMLKWLTFWSGGNLDSLLIVRPGIDPDPEPLVPVDAEIWQIVVSGLLNGERLSLVHNGGDAICTATADRVGIAQFTALLESKEGMNANAGPLLVHGASDQRERNSHLNLAAIAPPLLLSPNRGIAVKQVLLTRRLRVRPGGWISGLHTARFSGMPALAITSGHALSVYELDHSRPVRLIHHEIIPGLRGAIPWQDGFLTWGDEGLRCVSKRFAFTHRLANAPILNIVQHRLHLYVLTANAVEIYDSHMRRIETLDVSGGTCLAISGATLAVADDRSIRFFDLAARGSPRFLGQHPIQEIVALVSVQIAGRRNDIFAQRRDGGGFAFTVRHGEPEEIIRFQEHPWFASATTLGKTIIRVDPNGETFTIYVVSNTRDGNL